MIRWALLLTLLMPGTGAVAQPADEVAAARLVLGQIQGKSIATAREYCGLIGRRADGRLVASAPRRGSRASCRPRDPRSATDLVASYHTHGAFDEESDSELPSLDDVFSDMEEGIDGYLSTPGGRLWHVDGSTGTVRQLCGIGCLASDPAFDPKHEGRIESSYTLDALERFFRN